MVGLVVTLLPTSIISRHGLGFRGDHPVMEIVPNKALSLSLSLSLSRGLCGRVGPRTNVRVAGGVSGAEHNYVREFRGKS